jgi:pimeloyl-ACP methyl ester carboxylesterase
MARNWTKALAGAGAIAGGLVAWTAIAARTNEALVPADGSFCDIDGARLHYTDEGSGPVLVLIHGLMGQMRNFSYAVTEHLVRDYRVINVDRPGWGYSTLAPGAERPGIPQQASMIAALLDRLAIDKAVIVGHSLGGAVALAMALDHPQKVSGLALIAALTQPQDTPPEAFKGLMVPQPLSGVIAWTIAIPMATLTGAVAAQAVFAPVPLPLDFTTRGGGALGIRPKSFRAGAFELMSAKAEMEALVPRYGELDMPVSMLFARDDNVLKPEVHGEVTKPQIARAELTLTEGGHMLPVTRPDETIAFIRRAAARLA